jgi:hypothetical protein
VGHIGLKLFDLGRRTGAGRWAATGIALVLLDLRIDRIASSGRRAATGFTLVLLDLGTR